MMLLVSSLNASLYGQPLRLETLGRLAKAIPWVLGLYLGLKFGELYATGELGHVTAGDSYAWLFWTEMITVRRSRAALVTTASLVLAATLLNRFDVGLVGWFRPDGAAYFPSLLEVIMGIGIPALAMVAYDWVARNLPLFADEHGSDGHGSDGQEGGMGHA